MSTLYQSASQSKILYTFDDPWKKISKHFIPGCENVRRVVREENRCDYCGKEGRVFEYGVRQGHKIHKHFGYFCSVDCKNMAGIKERLDVSVRN